jgi:hypothetical protein
MGSAAILGRCAAALLLAVAGWAAAQPNLEALHKDWSAALAEWAQTGVEADRDLYRKPTAEALGLIGDAASKRRKLSAAKQRYVSALASHYRTLAREWRSPASQPAEPPSEVALRDALAAALAALDRQIQTLAAANRDSAPALQRQRTELLAVQSAMRVRQQARGRTGLATGPPPEDLEPAIETLLALANRFDNLESVLRQEAEAWEKVYARLRDEVERRAPKEPTPVERETAVVAAPAPQHGSAGSAMVPSLAGVWFLQNLDARKTEEGAYEPRFVNVRITQEGDAVQGSYECVFSVPEDEPYNPTVRFTFAGRITSELMRFPLRPPLRGSITVQRVGASQLHVSYSIENPDERGISFGYVGGENPQPLQKRLEP